MSGRRMITPAQLAAEWGVSKPRIYQQLSSGVLEYAAPGKIDYEAAQRVRKTQLIKHQSRALFTEHSNGGAKSEAKAAHFLAKKRRERALEEDDDDDLLALPGERKAKRPVDDDDDDLLALPGEKRSKPADDQDAKGADLQESEIIEAMERNKRASEIKLKLLEEQLLARQARRNHEMGLYVLRADAFRWGLETAKVTASVLNALPDQIAGIFARNPVEREEVRKKAAELISRAQQTIVSRLDKFGDGNDVV